MEPRFIMKTHNGALRPGNYSILISKCTYPDKGSYPETVIKRLGDILENNPKSSIAKFTVLTAGVKNRGFGFLLDNMIWTWKGHVINVVLSRVNKTTCEDIDVFINKDNLTLLERIAYLRYFLETEGALILKIAEKISEKGEITYSYLKENIQKIFQEIYEEYIDVSSDLRTRLENRKRLKELQRTYDESTLPHKVKPHIQALEDLGILTIREKQGEEIYSPVVSNGFAALSILFEKLANFPQMETAFSNYSYFRLIADALNLRPTKYDVYEHKELIEEAVHYGYSLMKDKLTGMADIDALIDWCCIKMLSEDNILIGKQDVERFFDEIRKQEPAGIRYHVDGKGRIAYVILSDMVFKRVG